MPRRTKWFQPYAARIPDKHVAQLVWQIKGVLREALPPDFEWEFVCGDDTRYCVRWRWKNTEPTGWTGGICDPSFEIMVALARGTKWDEERKIALRKFEDRETELLQAAQSARRDRVLPALPGGDTGGMPSQTARPL